MAAVWNALLPSVLAGSDSLYANDNNALKSLCAEKKAILTSDQRVNVRQMNKADCRATPLRQVYFRSHKGYAMKPNFTYGNLILKTYVYIYL
jgi:hypothetical protein